MREINEAFAKKADEYKKELRHTKVIPLGTVRFDNDASAFQKLRAIPTGGVELPIILSAGDEILLDFGRHCVGYLHFALNHLDTHITDSPIMLQLSFGEFALELVAKPEDYRGSLGKGWLQTETHTEVFTPCHASLSRRYSFRYLKIKRIDNAKFGIKITDIFADTVSAVDLEDCKKPIIEDERLRRIYDISLNTLKECEQEVFEDGPKRDRRLWIGDLRLQALTDYVSFGNIDLIKRCIYLFAAYPTESGNVAPYVFPDSPPYVDSWFFRDYSLFFVTCLYDYAVNTDDLTLPSELFHIAKKQIELCFDAFEPTGRLKDNLGFIDWCPGLDKQVAILGAAAYVFKQYRELTRLLGRVDEDINARIDALEAALLGFYDKERKLFITEAGQISYHSQIWSILAGVLPEEQNAQILREVRNCEDALKPHTPYMMHYYLEAMLACRLEREAAAVLKDYWGKIADLGFDCCPEIFNPDNHFESPYSDAPEINSACHAWSCTPVYWITKLLSDK